MRSEKDVRRSHELLVWFGNAARDLGNDQIALKVLAIAAAFEWVLGDADGRHFQEMIDVWEIKLSEYEKASNN